MTTHDHLREAWSGLPEAINGGSNQWSFVVVVVSVLICEPYHLNGRDGVDRLLCVHETRSYPTKCPVFGEYRSSLYLEILPSRRIRCSLFAGPAVSRDYNQCYCHVIVMPARKFDIFVALLDDKIIVCCTRAIDVINVKLCHIWMFLFPYFFLWFLWQQLHNYL